jgi:hypothetical protein
MRNCLTVIQSKIEARKLAKKNREHEAMIEAGKAKLAETKLVPGVVQIWC